MVDVKKYKFWISGGFIGLFLILIALSFVMNNQICGKSTFIYEGQLIPTDICLQRNVNYNVNGVLKSVTFTPEYIKYLIISETNSTR